MIIAASLVMFSPLASLSDGLIDCISLRNLYTKLGDSARRAEELKLNSVCPEKQFKQRLNTVSDWAWTIDTRARQYCRDEWRANSKPLYVNSTNKAFFSQDGALIASDQDALVMELQAQKCPTSDLGIKPFTPALTAP